MFLTSWFCEEEKWGNAGRVPKAGRVPQEAEQLQQEEFSFVLKEFFYSCSFTF